MPRAPRSGLTLIEVIVALAIVAVLAAVAVPSMREFLMQQRLKSAASELMADMQLARSTALSMASVPSYVNVSFQSNASLTCYSLAVVANPLVNCDCTRANNVCQFFGIAMTAPFRLVKIDRSTGITVTSPSQMIFTSSGMTTDRAARTVTLTASTGPTLHLVIGQTGFPRLCAPAGTNLSGVSSC